jgi:hypothetical protein
VSYVDDDLKRATALIMSWGPALAGIDVSRLCRSLCLAFHEVRRDAFERAALTVESCPVPADDIPYTHLFVTRDAVIAQRIRGLK